MKHIGGVLQQWEFKGVLRAQKLYIWHKFDLAIKTTTLRYLHARWIRETSQKTRVWLDTGARADKVNHRDGPS